MNLLRVTTFLFFTSLLVPNIGLAKDAEQSFAGDKVQKDKKVPTEFYYRQIEAIFDKITKDYVTDPDRQEMTDAAINGMLNSLDPHSSYFADEDFEDFVNQTKGEFGGIGVEIIYDHNAVKVISPIDDLPAYKAGIKAGDYIVGVDGDSVSNLGFYKAVKAMRGDPGTKVKLLVFSENDPKPREVELVREIVKIKPVKANMEDKDIAYVRIVSFNENTIAELKSAFKNLKAEAKDGKIQGIILDLRNNPGGLLEQAFAVGEYFIESGTIVSTKGRDNANNSVLTASRFVPKAPNVPIIVLINSGSASASEIVAGALQDHKRALIVGTKSFGKGSVQTFMQVSPRAAIKMTTAKYYTPSGRSIQAEGIEPDITIEVAKVDYPEKQDGDQRFSEASLKNYLKNDTKKETDSDKAKDKDKDDKKNEPKLSELYKKDYQFARSYDIMLGLILTKQE